MTNSPKNSKNGKAVQTRKKGASPCINVCRMGEDGLCLGCRRTIPEIRNWKSMPLSARLTLLAELKLRP